MVTPRECPGKSSVHADVGYSEAPFEPGKRTLLETRRQIEPGWRLVADVVAKDGHHALASDVRRFVVQMPPAKTERES